MTRPTDEQIKALRKGDVVTVRAIIGADYRGGEEIQLQVHRGTPVFAKTEKIMTIEPREIKVGDRVHCCSLTGLLVGIDKGQGFVRWDHSDHSVLALKSLQVIP